MRDICPLTTARIILIGCKWVLGRGLTVLNPVWGDAFISVFIYSWRRGECEGNPGKLSRLWNQKSWSNRVFSSSFRLGNMNVLLSFAVLAVFSACAFAKQCKSDFITASFHTRPQTVTFHVIIFVIVVGIVIFFFYCDHYYNCKYYLETYLLLVFWLFWSARDA